MSFLPCLNTYVAVAAFVRFYQIDIAFLMFFLNIIYLHIILTLSIGKSIINFVKKLNNSVFKQFFDLNNAIGVTFAVYEVFKLILFSAIWQKSLLVLDKAGALIYN